MTCIKACILVGVLCGVAITSPAVTLSNAGFETPVVGATSYQYNPTGAGWFFATSLAGVSGSNSAAFTSGLVSPPEGVQAAFLQRTGIISQSVTFAAGSYIVTFRGAQRNGNQHEGFRVMIDNSVAGSFTPLTGSAYLSYTTSVFLVSSGPHGVSFVGTNTADNSAILDDVRITQVGPSMAVTNLDATSITPSSACLNGTLTTNVGAEPRVLLFWGTSDGGTNMASWANTNDCGVNTQPYPVSLSTNIDTLASNTLYCYRYCATNDSGFAWGQPVRTLITGGVGIQAAANASEYLLTPGSFTVYRPLATTNAPLTLTYAQTGGTAAAGTNFVALSGSVTIPAGTTTASIVVTPLWDTSNSSDTTLQLTLTSTTFAYDMGNATLTIRSVNGRTWTGGAGNWNDPAKWSPSGAPSPGDYVTITNAGAFVTLSNQTEWIDTLFLSNTAALFFTNYDTNTTICLQATNVLCYGSVSQAVNTATSTNAAGEWPVNSRIYVACSNFTLGSAGKLNGNGCGYITNYTAGTGYGPGAGKYDASRPGGGAYGGRGGAASAVAGVPYGSATNPVQPGSSGGTLGSAGNAGGNGGGLVRIDATGRVTVDGPITVNGNRAAAGSGGGGGGSGGGVYVTCGTLSGSGSITADGGNGGGGDVNTGGGGGGRIAVLYDPTAQANVTPPPTIAFSANPSVTSYNTTQPRPGTLYLSDGSLFPTPVSLGGQIANPASTSCVLSSLTVTNDSLLIFPTGTILQVTGNLLVSGKGGIELPYGSLTVGTNAVFGSSASPFGSVIRLASDGIVSVGSNLTLSTGPLRVYGNLTNIATVSAGGSMLVSNGASFYLYCGISNALATNYAALVAVTGDLTVAASSWIYPVSDPTNGGSALFRMQNLNLLSGGGFNANGLGYGPKVGRGNGPGGGGSSSARGGGGGYGGTGGVASAVAGTGGGTYGSSNAPVDPGSAGGGSTTVSGTAYGGGLVRIEAVGTVTVAGSITANGSDAAVYGGGSGGGVFIRCQTTAGSGTISANGGNGANNSGDVSGNGGGGRVAMADMASDTFNGTITVNPGSGTGNSGKTGTIVRLLGVSFSTMIVQGNPAAHGIASPYNYGSDGVVVGTLITNAVNSPADETNGLRYVCLGWAVTNTLDPLFLTNGTGTQAVFQASSNLVQTWFWTNQWALSLANSPGGSLTANPGGWYTNMHTVPISAVASDGYYFVQWTGIGAPSVATLSNQTVTMDRVRTLQANFASQTPGVKSWTGTGDWANPTNWAPPGMPGVQDTVTVASGTATLSDSITVGALRLTNSAILILTNATLTCVGDLVLTNAARLYVCGGLASGIATNAGTWVNVGGDMTVASNTWVYPTSHPTNGGSGFFRMRHLNVMAGGGFDANGRGFVHQVGASVPGRGTGAGGAGGARSGGGGYGGAGGCPAGVTGGNTYGSSNAPVDPGSSAGNHSLGDLGGDGGGLIHIVASGNIGLYGTLTANGINGAGGAGGGSGGGVFLSCFRLSGGGPISANGGAGVNADAGAGGGGRIAIWAMDWSSYSGTVTEIKGAQWYGGDGTLVWKPLAWPGSVFTFR